MKTVPPTIHCRINTRWGMQPFLLTSNPSHTLGHYATWKQNASCVAQPEISDGLSELYCNPITFRHFKHKSNLHRNCTTCAEHWLFQHGWSLWCVQCGVRPIIVISLIPSFFRQPHRNRVTWDRPYTALHRCKVNVRPRRISLYI